MALSPDEIGRALARIESQQRDLRAELGREIEGLRRIVLSQAVYEADEKRRAYERDQAAERQDRIEEAQTWAFRLVIANLVGVLGAILLQVLK